MTLTREQIAEYCSRLISAGFSREDIGGLCGMALRTEEAERALMSAQAALAQQREEAAQICLTLPLRWNWGEDIHSLVNKGAEAIRALASPKGEQQTHTGDKP